MTGRRPIGLTVPYREVGYKEPPTMQELEKKIKQLEERIKKLEQQHEEKK